MGMKLDLSQPNRFRHLERWDNDGSTALTRRRAYVEDFIRHFKDQHRLALAPLVGPGADAAVLSEAVDTVLTPAFRDRLARSLVSVIDAALPVAMDTAIWGELHSYFARGNARTRG